MDLMLFDNVIAFDHYRQKIYLITGVRSADLEQSYEKSEAKFNEIEKLLKTGEKMEFPPIQLKTEIKPQFSEEKYEEMVEKAKHYIREGDIFHGMKSYFCQDEYGQIAPVYSISAGLDYPGVGPEHAHLYDLGRAKYVPVTDDEAVDAFEYLSRIEGIIPELESAHAVAYAKKIVPQMDKDEIVVITLSGRGDKDCAAIARYRGEDIHE